MSHFKKFSLLLSIIMILGLALGACTETTLEPAAETATVEEAEPVEEAAEPVEETAEPVEETAEPVEETAETVEEAAETVEEAAEPVEETAETAPTSAKSGGILRHAIFAPNNLDPAFLSTVADDTLGRQWNDFLVFVAENSTPDLNRGIAESYILSEDGLEYTFTLRQNVVFHDGKPMTSRDVKFTFDRLRDPEVGAATVALYANIVDITAPDDYTVVFQLEKPNPDFLLDLGDYHALIMDADNKDFATNFNGTGAFSIESYMPEDRIVFKRNPNYWLTDDEGNQLPYLDGMEFIFLSDPSAQLEALRGGQIDMINYLNPEFFDLLDQDPNTVVYSAPSNSTYLIHMRADQGVASDPMVRQALKYGTDNEAILETAVMGLGVVGSHTPFGPVYGDFYLDTPFVRDVESAKTLLAEAGYADGLEIDLHVQELAPSPAIATLWQQQMAEIGVTVNILLEPSDVYYGHWLDVDFGITDWGSRPYPQPYLALAYICTAEWNESHWCDEELDELAAQTASELDHDARVAQYHRIQEIFMERGPVIVPFFKSNTWGANAKLGGIVPTSALGTALDLRQVYFEK